MTFLRPQLENDPGLSVLSTEVKQWTKFSLSHSLSLFATEYSTVGCWLCIGALSSCLMQNSPEGGAHTTLWVSQASHLKSFSSQNISHLRWLCTHDYSISVAVSLGDLHNKMLPQYLGGGFADDLILILRWRMTTLQPLVTRKMTWLQHLDRWEKTWPQPLVRGRWPDLSLWGRGDDLTIQPLSLSGEVVDDLTSASGEGRWPDYSLCHSLVRW